MTPRWQMAVGASIGAGLIHLALGPEHVTELGVLGLGFYLAAGLQLAWAVLAGVSARARWRTDRPGARPTRNPRSMAIAGITINGAILAAWAVSRLVGLPAGAAPWVPEAIGRADAVAAVLQGAIIVALARSLGAGAEVPRARMARPAIVAAATFLVIGAGTTIGLLPGGHAHAGSHGPPAEAADHHHGELDAAPAPDAHVAGPGRDQPAPGAAGVPDAAPVPRPRVTPGPAGPGSGSPATPAPATPAPATPAPADDHPHVDGAADHSH